MMIVGIPTPLRHPYMLGETERQLQPPCPHWDGSGRSKCKVGFKVVSSFLPLVDEITLNQPWSTNFKRGDKV